MARRLAFLLVLLAGCGGGTADPTPPPPPPPPPAPPGPPAAVAVQAGTGQEAEPGQTVPLPPAVVVRDASGRPVQGVAVTFAVDSGGGSLAATAATTGGDGIAMAGAWTLGRAEGVNVVSAAVASLAPARVTAVARFRTTSVGALVLPPAGGATALTAAGPLAGLSIEAPAGAFGAPATVTVGYQTATGLSVDSVVRIASPLISLETSAAGPTEKLFTIRVPAGLAADEFPVVAFVDPATGVLSVLPTVRYDSTSVTAEFGAFSARPAVALGGPASLARIDVKAWIAVLASKLSISAFQFDLGFAPGVDDWDFERLDTPIGGTGLGQVLTQRFYYLAKKSVFGALRTRGTQAPGIPTSNAAGIYWSAGLTRDLTPLATRHVDAGVARSSADPAGYRRNTLYSTLLGMVLTRRPPVLIAVYPDRTVRPVLAYRWQGPAGRLYHANPEFPGSPDRYSLWNSGQSNCDPNECTMVAGFDGFESQLESQFADVLAGTAYKDQFPATFLGTLAPVADADAGAGQADTLFLVDGSANVWVEMPTWPFQLAPSSPPMHGAAGFQELRLYLESAPGLWNPYPGGSSGPDEGIDQSILQASETDGGVDRRIAVEARAVDPPNQTTRWAGFKFLRVIKFLPELSVAEGGDGAPTQFELITQGGPTLPQALDYRVTWNDGTPATVFRTRPTIFHHTFPDDDRREVVLEMIHPGLNKVIARTAVEVGEDAPAAAFRFTSLALAYSTEGPQISGDGRWRVDTTRLERIRDGLTQGAVQLVEKSFGRFCALCGEQFVAEGLYLLEGSSITAQSLYSEETFSGYATAPLAGATLTLPTPPRINAWALVRVPPAGPHPVCVNPPTLFQRVGNAVSGRLQATYTHYCFPNPFPSRPQFPGFPGIIVDLDVTFSAGVAEGVITLTYQFPQNSVGPVIQRKRVRINFTGARVN